MGLCRRNLLLGLSIWLFAGSLSLPAQAPSDRLLEAAAKGDARAAAMELERGAPVDATDSRGVSALAHAVFGGHEAAVRVLLRAGADTDLPDHRGRTPWSWAAYRGDVEAIEALLRAGADANRTITGGVTALMLAALQGHEPAVRLLLEAGADPETRDDEGSTASDWAIDRGHRSIATLIAQWAGPSRPPDSSPLNEASGPLDGWDPRIVDTAAGVDYLNATERAIVLELNKVRTDPSRYARLYLAPLRRRFDGSILHFPDAIPVRTEEGIAALEECIRELSATTPVGALAPRPGLSRAAADHVADQGPTGALGHTGSDGSSPGDRVRRYETDLATWGENVAYGWDDAFRIVFQLLVDDGVPDRGHRRNIMNPRFTAVGVSVGAHRRYDHMMAMSLAAFRDR